MKITILWFAFWSEIKKRISKNIFHFSNLINAFKKEKRKQKFFILFWFKISSKKQKLKFSNSWISKRPFIFWFRLWNWKMKNEKFSKFVLFLNQKTNYIFGTRINPCTKSIIRFKNKTNFKSFSFFIFIFKICFALKSGIILLVHGLK